MLKNLELGNQVLEMLKTLIEAGEDLLFYAKEANTHTCDILMDDMKSMLESIFGVCGELKADEPSLNIDLACESSLYSLNRIIATDNQTAIKKIEFELIPLLKDMYLRFYFFGMVYPDKEKMDYYYKNEMVPLSANHYIDEAKKTGDYKYDLSVVIIAYNKLEYTMTCVNSFLKYMPTDINYELILYNHGSSDTTKEYFEKIKPHKQVDVYRNGGGQVFHRIYEGKYSLEISNDIVLTENCIKNLYNCITSSDDIIWAVPTTPNVSNYQTIPAEYDNINEMQEFAKNNNVSNPYRWERRTRLCNPVTMQNNELTLSREGLCYGGYFISDNGNLFPDDKVGFMSACRGYKLMLAKDAYCFHFGSVTIKDDIVNIQNEQNYYFEGRKIFYNAFGVDPWGTGFCYNYNLFSLLTFENKENINILGVCSGLGSNPLKAQQTIKENFHNNDAKLYNITDERAYINNLKGLSDEFEFCVDYTGFSDAFKGTLFDYIIIDKDFHDVLHWQDCINGLYNRLNPKGKMAIFSESEIFINKIKSMFKNAEHNGEWVVWSKE